MAVSHYTQAGICGWLPLTAAYLKASQLQPALALLQHAVADSHSRHLCHDSALTAAPAAAAAAARQLAAEWAALVLNVIRDGAVPGGLTQLLFPSPQHQQLGTSQVAKKKKTKEDFAHAHAHAPCHLISLSPIACLVLPVKGLSYNHDQVCVLPFHQVALPFH